MHCQHRIRLMFFLYLVVFIVASNLQFTGPTLLYRKDTKNHFELRVCLITRMCVLHYELL